MFGVKKTRIPSSKWHNHGGITIVPGVEEMPTPNGVRPSRGGIELITVSRVEEMALFNFKLRRYSF